MATSKRKPKAPKAQATAPDTQLQHKSIRLDPELLTDLMALAEVRDMSFSAVMRSAGEMYLMREQFAVGLQNVEANIGATLNASRRDINRVADDVQLLIAYVDQLTKFLMMALPDVIDKEGAVALGNRRHAGFIADFHKAFNSRKKKSNLSLEIERQNSEE